MPTNRKRYKRGSQKCPLWLWQIFIDNPLPPGHPEYNSFQIFVQTSEWLEHKAEVLDYWIRKKVPRGVAKAVFLRKEGLLTDKELKLIKGNYEVKNG